MPPTPRSPAIDAGFSSATNADQRGVFRPIDGEANGSAVADLGAVEADPVGDTVLYWTSDLDGDGDPHGMELALGTNPLVQESQSESHLVLSGDDGTIAIQYDPSWQAWTTWVLYRSFDLSPGSFVEIFRAEAGVYSVSNGATFVDGNPVIITDLGAGDRAFYHLETELVSP